MFVIVAFIVLLLVIVLVAVFSGDSSNSEAKKLQELRLSYDKALKETCKRTALNAGRTYYAALRKNKALTMYDELAISNDLSTMGSAMPAV